MLRTIFTCTIFIAAISVQAQSGWSKPKGTGFFKLSQDILRAGSFFNPDGEVIDITTTSVYSTNVYGEFGISDRVTGILSAPLFVRSTLNERESTVDGFVEPGDEFNGIGDISFGAQYGLIQNRSIVVALHGMLKLPTGNPVGGETELLQSGDGAWGFTGLVAASHSFYPTPMYVSVYGGFQWRGEAELDYSNGPVTIDYDDAVRWGAELGWTPENWQVALKLAQVIPLENGSDDGLSSNSIFGNRIAYFSITPEVAYVLDNGFGFSFALGTAAFAQNILAAPNFNLGVFYLVK